MKYTTIMKMLDVLEQEDRAIALHIAVASAVRDNIHTNEYDDDGINELCQRIDACYCRHSDETDLDIFVFYIQSLIDDGEYATATEECLETAWEMARENVSQW